MNETNAYSVVAEAESDVMTMPHNLNTILRCMQSIKTLFLFRVSQEKYTKLIKCSLKLITSINNMLLSLDSTQSTLNFEPSFVGIHQVLRNM